MRALVTNFTKFTARVLMAARSVLRKMVVSRSCLRSLNMKHSVVVPFIQTRIVLENEPALKPRETYGDLRCVNHHAFNRKFEYHPAGERIHGHLIVGVVVGEEPWGYCGSGGFLVLDIYLVGVLNHSVQVAAKDNIVIDW